MNILAIDPGIEKVGYSIFQKKPTKGPYRYIISGIIRTNKNSPLHERLQLIYNKLDKLVEKYSPKIMVIEQIFFFKNAKTIVAVAQSQGVALLLAAQKKIAVVSLTPLQIKQSVTGYGNADKQAVQKMLRLQLDKQIQFIDDDESDAIAGGLAYCLLQSAL